MNIKTIMTLGLAMTMLVVPTAASAQTVSPVQNANQTARLATLHTTCDTQINNRLTSLSTAATRVSGLVKLSSTQKTQYTGEITTDVNALTTLKAKCDADTDLPTLRADYKTIFTTYRVYAEFLPQLHLLVASDTMSVTASKLSDFATKLQARIQTAGNQSTLTSLLTDMQAKITDANTQYANVESQVTSLTPQSYDSNPTGTTSTLKGASSEIKTGSSDLQTAWSDAKQILQALKVSVNTVSPSVTP